ncbi:LysR family transcriptional regulator [Pelagibius sp. Alg239-R121]|uniref:LysR family transcriptional regulator n=1 Tax=Pelagibius sp. Alg239-R121 TaxID=2993448 RepID=UPI0024A753DF|nr:LysR family transcriptional regulator [Pelagibius sp. Alg239-R121]
MTYRLPSLNTLRAFEAAARHLSFKTAASELGVTAGAVSQQVKKLETSLGVYLFRRLPHGLLLTREGETYLPSITKVFEDLTQATETIAPRINSKKFRVGMCSAVKAMLPANWPNHSDGLRNHVRDWIETRDVEKLRTNEIDCLIRPGGGPYGELALVIIPIASSPEALHFVCKPGLADCSQSKAILHDLMRICSEGPLPVHDNHLSHGN